MIRTGLTDVDVSVIVDGHDLERILDERDAGELVATDLCFGSRRGFHAARELGAQLDVTIDVNVFGMPVIMSTNATQKVAGWIDAEGQGESIIALAYDLAERIAAAPSVHEKTLLCVLLPRSGYSISVEDGWFLYFLAAACEQCGQALQFLQIAGTPLQLPPGLRARRLGASVKSTLSDTSRHDSPFELLTIFPGIVRDLDVVRFAENRQVDHCLCLPLKGGYSLISPECRVSLSRVGERELQALQNFAEEIDWVKAFALIQRSEKMSVLSEAETLELMAQSWNRAGEGGIGLAQVYFEHAVNEAKGHYPHLYGTALLDLQSLRIAARSFEAAADCKFDDSQFTPALTSDLHLTVGWGQIMNGHSTQAEKSFARVRRLNPRDARSAIDLYLLNIFALNEFRAGRHDHALSIEQAIERQLALLPSPNWHLQYVNHFNLSRLFRAAGDYQTSRHHLEAGFHTTQGLRTESDAIYFNLSLARLYQKTGDISAALKYYWLASVHGLCANIPEAIAWRTLLSFFGTRIYPAPESPAHVAEAMNDLLATVAVAAGFDTERLKHSASSLYCSVSRAKLLDGKTPRACWLLPGFASIITTDSNDVAPVFVGESFERLARLATAIFEWRAGLPAGSFSGGIMIDSNYGTEVPSALPDAIPSALRWNSRSVHVLGPHKICVTSFSWEDLDYDIAPGVAEIRWQTEGERQAIVSFKRYRRDVQLKGPAAVALHCVTDKARSFAEIYHRLMQAHPSTTRDDCVHLLQRLEEQRVVLGRSES